VSESPLKLYRGYNLWQWLGWAVAVVVGVIIIVSIVTTIIAIRRHRDLRRSPLRGIGAALAIARVTAAEALRKRVLYAILVFGVGCLLAVTLFSSYEPSEQDVMVKDLGLTLITMFASLIVIVTSISLIPDEVERRTIYPIMAKPVRRSEFLVGKFLGVQVPVAISMVVMLIALMAIMAIKFHSWPWALVMAVALLFFAMMVLTGAVIMVSTRTSAIVAALVGVVVFALGFNMERLYHLADPAHATSKFNAVTLGLLAAVLPNLSMFDLRVEAASPPQYYPWPQMWALFGNGVLYAIGYLAVLMIASSLLFSRREL
jgi:ABC-type transport system involved in multi-copper enzyme maturation permease subunit